MRYTPRPTRPTSLFLALLVTVVAANGCTALVRPNFTPELVKLRPGQYQLDPMHSYLIFRIDHLGLSKIVGRFNRLEANLDFDPEKPDQMRLRAIVESASIDVNNTDLETTLQDKNWFDTTHFPQITFNNDSVEITDTGELNLAGTLSMRGISRTINLKAKFNGGADNLITRKYTIGFSASTIINRSDFGMDAFSAFVGDTVEVEAHGEFLKQ